MFEPALGIERLGTIKEISALAGVAESTVHRALKGQPKLSAPTRARVIRAVRQINAEKIKLARGARRNEQA
jgi:DNA-binding LacI/PurR family transcriptional regulator